MRRAPHRMILAAVLLGSAGAVFAAAGAARSPGDVFAGNGASVGGVARGAVLSLRQDAANGAGGPQLGLDPAYPPSLQQWLDVKRDAAAAAALYQTCADVLIQATNEVRRVAPLMRPPITRLKELNAGLDKTRALLGQGDDCIAKVDAEVNARISGGVSTQGGPTPSPVPNSRSPVTLRGGVTSDGSGGTVSGGATKTVPIPQPPLSGGAQGGGSVPLPPAVGSVVPHGYLQPDAPNYACYDRKGYPYTVMVDPGAETKPYGGVPRFGVQEPPRIPPVRGGYDECINPHPPLGCPPREYRGGYQPIKRSDACLPAPTQRDDEAPIPVFHYYYVNGINTPEHDPSQPANAPPVLRGNYDWDCRLIARNLLGTGNDVNIPGVPSRQTRQQAAELIRVAANEQNVFETGTYNFSGAQPYLQQLCASGNDWLFLSLCEAMKSVNQRRAAGEVTGMANGDLLESGLQVMGREKLNLAATDGTLVGWVQRILDIYRGERDDRKTKLRHYFILIGHSQGNFFVEGMAWRLANLSGEPGREVFANRLAILSLASPTDYPSLQGSTLGPAFAARRLQHATRADDAILSLKALATGLGAKAPFDANEPALWPYKTEALRDMMRLLILKPGGQGMGVSFPIDEAMKLGPGQPCKPEGSPRCNHALYTPLMNSHLIDNYLTDPTLTAPDRPLNFSLLPSLETSRMHAPFPEVLSDVRNRLRTLKAGLLDTGNR